MSFSVYRTYSNTSVTICHHVLRTFLVLNVQVIFLQTKWPAHQTLIEIAHAREKNLPDCLLIEFFCDGINQPLRSELRRGGLRLSLAQFMDYALLTVGSLFTVGVTEEECDTVSVTEMADTPERVRKMAATTTPCQVTANLHKSSQVAADLRESSQVTADLCESIQVTVDRHESSKVTVDLPESSKVTVDLPEPSKVTVDRPESTKVTADHHESRQVSADLLESHHVPADRPEFHRSWPSRASPRRCWSSRVWLLLLSAETRSSRSVFRYPSLVYSVRDATLVSARTAGIPKPTHSNTPGPELIPLFWSASHDGDRFMLRLDWRTPPQNCPRWRRPLGCIQRWRRMMQYLLGVVTPRCCVSTSNDARFRFLHGGGAQQITLSVSLRDCCRTSRGGDICCRTSRGVSVTQFWTPVCPGHSQGDCRLSCHSQKGCPELSSSPEPAMEVIMNYCPVPI